MIDDSGTLAVRLGKAQIEAMVARQRVAPLDDSEFLPMLEAVLTVYEDVLSDTAVAEELWERPPPDSRIARRDGPLAGKGPTAVHRVDEGETWSTFQPGTDRRRPVAASEHPAPPVSLADTIRRLA